MSTSITNTYTGVQPVTPVILRQRLMPSAAIEDDDQDDAVQLQLMAESRQFSKHRRLLLWSELAPWRQHGSDSILTRYRQENPSVKECFKSWFYLHNETVNILSHAVGAVLFAGLVVTLWTGSWPWQLPDENENKNTKGDLLAGTVYLVGVGVCFALSATYHTLLGHSQHCAARGMDLDIAGVLLLMAGATTPLIHFGLVCAPQAALVRAAFHIVTAVLGTLCVVSSTSSWIAYFAGPAHGHRRVLLFCAFAAVSFAGPMLWMALVVSDPDWMRRIDLWPGVLGTLFFNTLGAAAYLLRFPEHIWPRRFDLVGSSHQIMHTAVLIAAISLAIGVDHSLSFRRGEGAVCRV